MKQHDAVKLAVNSFYGSFGVTLSYDDAMKAVIPDFTIQSKSDVLKEKLHNLAQKPK